MGAPKGNKFAVGNKGGRTSKFKKEFVEQAYKLALLGATDDELADFFRVRVSTIHNWKKRHNEFLDALKRGKEVADANVSDRLFQRAMGFEHDSEEIKVVNGVVERVPVRKIYPPDPTSAIFWLKNRQPEKWRDKQTTELTGKDGKDLMQNLDLSKLSDKELIIYHELIKKAGASEK